MLSAVKSRAILGERLALLEDLCRERTSGLDPVQETAAAVIDAAGRLEGRLLCDAAYSLCELIDRLRARGACDWPAIAVHVRALRLIYKADPGDAATHRPVVDGLWRVTELYKDEPAER